jgi:hypothetical protein
MYAANVLVVKAVFAAYKNFEEGPVSHERNLKWSEEPRNVGLSIVLNFKSQILKTRF